MDPIAKSAELKRCKDAIFHGKKKVTKVRYMIRKDPNNRELPALEKKAQQELNELYERLRILTADQHDNTPRHSRTNSTNSQRSTTSSAYASDYPYLGSESERTPTPENIAAAQNPDQPAPRSTTKSVASADSSPGKTPQNSTDVTQPDEDMNVDDFIPVSPRKTAKRTLSTTNEPDIETANKYTLLEDNKKQEITHSEDPKNTVTPPLTSPSPDWSRQVSPSILHLIGSWLLI
ncbi:hypothetical protein HNY73_015113 [Argiope bruennichi]|uniref:Uncharacterized protein n=1 Tax=Argiope bruennichi TaxID=94029 RepID=A0A8T0ER35_ARGBR|nr:hypothetical protein HNY73_015113 [Argiope bruennichi]